MQKASIGRIVNFFRHSNDNPIPGIVTSVFTSTEESNLLNLALFNERMGKVEFTEMVPHKDDQFPKKNGQYYWDWPARV